MAQSKAKSKAKGKATAKSASRASGKSRSASSSTDAVALLKADHRQVEEWFEAFEKSRSDAKKQDLATKICSALRVHTTIEEEVFYPAFLEEAGDEDIHHEAIVEHSGAKDLIAQIEGSSPDDDYFDAKVKVLSEMIKHHVKEEEQPGGMFAEARQSGMDLKALGEQMARRKSELESGGRSSQGSRRGENAAAFAKNSG